MGLTGKSFTQNFRLFEGVVPKKLKLGMGLENFHKITLGCMALLKYYVVLLYNTTSFMHRKADYVK